MPVILGTGAYRYEVVDSWAKLPPGREFNADVAAVGVDAQDRVYAFNRGAHPMVVLRPRRQLPALLGRGRVPPRARRAHGARRHAVADRRRRPHRPPLHARRQGAADARHPRQADALHERRAVPPLHAHGAVAARRALRLRRLRQRARPQVRAGRQAALLVGRARHRPGPVQHPAQHRLRRRRLGLRRRPREPPHPGVRRQRQVRDAVDQHAPPLGPVHAARRPRRASTSARSAAAWASTSTCRTSARGSASTARKGELLARLGNRPAGLEPGQFISPHGLAVDSRGDIYVGEVSFTNWGRARPGSRPACGACRSSSR